MLQASAQQHASTHFNMTRPATKATHLHEAQLAVQPRGREALEIGHQAAVVLQLTALLQQHAEL